ncbi:cip1-interacting zinc finger protein isoform X1 [Vombatus ursinus]|uniref:Matrin-type domain-containing protein n=1 Tax=Vombatus ursinus TaxID=29139 RepID=A0A4X2LIR7_VOMUR|nr:cip1-interacting zinc finger protein isoform X1 [Vombatus ursinus]XP_027725071.1 cip1-interacting zinc finger protein isoform X1 [Vombatus ursinus]XP_027725072.1 cip1-interacting zinc finger protein isoform X1 [Vombatus ursinus]XP_027725073.1 cip1-interacting zinc finger protein isoform X1 [Vombatus ursinus]XP_027725078.1 cip1-interacting zinc finger protein isoform X1 [Vombatus ursinus]
MFSQQHQFQQQLLQIQQLIQQQQQQQQQQHPPPPSAGRGLSPQQQQQQILNLRTTGQASLLNSNPMLQRALLMQHMQAGRFNMTAPGLQHFFPQATRHSLLGPPPVSVSLKPARLGFPGLPFQRQNRGYRKESLKSSDQKKDVELGSSSQTPSEDEKIDVPEPSQEEAHSQMTLPEDPQTPPDPSDDGSSEPLAKRLKSVEDTTDPKEETGLTTEKEEQAAEADPPDNSKDWKVPEEPKSLEVIVSSGSSLKVTIQQSSESRAISTTAPKPGPRLTDGSTLVSGPEPSLKFFCYICKINCFNQQNFQAHMAGLQHQQRLGEIQHMSNACLLSLLPTNREQGALAERDGEPQSQRWCNTCQTHFLGDLIKHRRTQEHKLAKHSLRPFCTACSRHFKTPRKFVEHMKSPEHKKKAKEARLGEKEPGSPEEAEELITVDAVGCFEEDEDEEDEEEDAEEDEGSEAVGEGKEAKQVGPKEVSADDWKGPEEYCPDKTYGLDFLVPVVGYLCRLCHKFYHSSSGARLAHCKSLMHFENVQRYRAARNPGPVSESELKREPLDTLTGEGTGASGSEQQEEPAQPPGAEYKSGGPDTHADADNTDGAQTPIEAEGGEKPGSGKQKEGEEVVTTAKGRVPAPEPCRRSTRHKPR